MIPCIIPGALTHCRRRLVVLTANHGSERHDNDGNGLEHGLDITIIQVPLTLIQIKQTSTMAYAKHPFNDETNQ